MSRSTGGVLDMAAYEALAGKHRPTDAKALAAEIRRLYATGLRPRDIAGALRLTHAEVFNVLGNDNDQS